MAAMKLDAVTVTSSDIIRAAKFYALLGFRFPEFAPGEKHLEAVATDGAVRFMIDDRELMRSITGVEPRPASHSSFAIKCANAAEVDACAARIREAGFSVSKEPWDAFWGQRYAIVADPDGYLIDLFAPL